MNREQPAEGGHNTAGVNEWNLQRPGWEMPIHNLCVKHGVNIVYHGHDHDLLYVKEELDGVIYQEVPQPGHLRVTVSPDEVRSEYIRSFLPGKEPRGHRNGQVAHEYTLRPWQPT